MTLSASAVGGVLGGVLADRIGRARTLMLSVAVYSVFTFLSGLATSYEMLMVLRVFQGIGFGAEWGVGAVLVAELVRPESRGRALGVVQSAWAAGWALAVLAYLVAFEVFAEGTAWRVLMCLGILPALLILYVRSRVEDPEVFRSAERQETGAPLREDPERAVVEDDRGGVGAGDRHPGRLLRDVHVDPDVPEDRARPDGRRHVRLSVRGHRGRVPRLPDGGVGARQARPPPGLRALRGAGGWALVLYFLVPEGANTALLIVGFPLGFFASGCFSGFGSYLAELFPTHPRATGGGLLQRRPRRRARCSRASSASWPRPSGWVGAIAFGVLGYVLAICALVVLLERRAGTSREPLDLLSARVYDLEQPRYAGLPIHPGPRAGCP